jgi:GNAT superfamily N-acetyltransferase
MAATSSPVVLHEGYEPGAVGRIVELHGRFYAGAWGAGAPFEVLIAREVGEFLDSYDPAHDLLVTAHLGEAMVGSLAMVGRTERPGWAQMRFVIVDPACHRRGAGKAMLRRGLSWSRARGYAGIFLWTVDNLPASRAMYEKAGFTVVECCPDDRYTVPRDCLRMELPL